MATRRGTVSRRQAGALVLMGGPDAERAISLESGTAVAGALRADGRYRVAEKVIDTVDADDVLRLCAERDTDVIVPILHGAWGEGGPLQSVLETAGIPYVGSPPDAAALAMDKLRSKVLLGAGGVRTPPAVALEAGDACSIAPPLVLKPIDEGSSVDLRICHTEAEVQAERHALHPKRGRLLAEAYVDGRELTVGLLDGAVLPIIEIVPAVDFYDYAAKYERADTRYVLDPVLPDDVVDDCLAMALTAFRAIGCRDLARVDLMLDERGPWFLEINTMPGFTAHSLVPMAARAVGLPMPDLCAKLVEIALGRHPATAAPA